MKVATLIAAASSFAASPAFATSTIECTSPARARLGFHLSVGSGPGQAVSSVHMVDAGTEFTTGLNRTSPVLAQSWLDDRELKFDIIDSNVEHYVARVSTRKARRDTYVGTLRYRGRVYRLTCTWQD
jgi:hypothetical protein